MKKQLLTKLIVLSCACIGLGMAPVTRAAQQTSHHFTNFLDTLQAAVSNQLATNTLTASQSNALVRARNTLNRNSRTLSSDLLQLQTASGILDRGFPETNAVLVEAAETIYLAFLTEAQAQELALLENVDLFTNGVPQALANQVIQITNALGNAVIATNSVAQRSQALGLALNKIRVANILAARFIKAPASLAGKSVQLTSGRGRNTHRLTLAAANFDQATPGGWTYQRTNSNTGIITVRGALPPPNTDYTLVFKTTTTGSFTSETSDFGTNGTFRVFKPRGL